MLFHVDGNTAIVEKSEDVFAWDPSSCVRGGSAGYTSSGADEHKIY